MTPEQARLCVNVFSAVVLASVAVALANLTWRLFGYSGEEPVLLPASSVDSQIDDLGPIFALAPFGVAVSGPASVEGASGGTLKAIFASTTPTASVALIAGSDGTVAEYGVGDSTPAGIIEQIENEHVVLRTGSGQRILGFDPDPPGTATSGDNTNRSVPTRAITTPSPQPAFTTAPSGVDAIRALIPQAQKGNSPVSPPPPPPAPASAAPPIGYNVGGSPSAAMKAAGIRSGDVIRSVNGKPITGSTDPGSVLAVARGAGYAQVEVMRGGKVVSLSVPTR